MASRVRFEHTGKRLHAVTISRSSRSPIISTLHRALLAMGIVVVSYQARPGQTGLSERIAVERSDGGPIEAGLDHATRAAILELLGERERTLGG